MRAPATASQAFQTDILDLKMCPLKRENVPVFQYGHHIPPPQPNGLRYLHSQTVQDAPYHRAKYVAQAKQTAH